MRTLTFLLFSLLFLGGFSVHAQIGLEFSMVNPTIVAGTPNQLQFDIMVKATGTPAIGSYHLTGQMYLNYNTVAFGSSIATGGGLTIIPGALLNETVLAGSPKYNGMLSIQDNSASIVTFRWEPIGGYFPPPPTMDLTEMPTTLTHLYTIRMDIVNSAQLAGLTFNLGLMNGNFFYTTNPAPPFPGLVLYNPLTVDNDFQTLDLGTVPPNLPVELTSFQAKGMEDQIDLFWETAQEINNKGFFLERRQAGLQEFQSLGWVEGNGSTQEASRYNFVDADVVSGLRYSYRLKQVDLDGEFSYSHIVNAYLSNTSGIITRVYPNPAQDDKVYLELQAEESTSFTYKLSDIAGKVVASKTIHSEAGLNTIPIDLSGLSTGVYQLQVSDYNRHSWVFRILK